LKVDWHQLKSLLKLVILNSPDLVRRKFWKIEYTVLYINSLRGKTTNVVDSPPKKKTSIDDGLKSHPFPSSHWDGLFQKAVGYDAASKHIDGHSWWDSRHPTGVSWNLTGHSGVLYWVHWILGKLFSYTTSWGYCFSSKISRPRQWIQIVNLVNGFVSGSSFLGYHTTMNQTQRSRGGNYRLVQEPSVAYITAMWYTVTRRAETETEAYQPVLNACCGKLTLAVWCAFLTSR
jgi:hypothetical protein